MDAGMMDAVVQLQGARAMGMPMMGAADAEGGMQGLFAALFGQLLEQSGQEPEELLAGLLAGGEEGDDPKKKLLGMELLAQSLFTPQALPFVKDLQAQAEPAAGAEAVSAAPAAFNGLAQLEQLLAAVQAQAAAGTDETGAARDPEWDALLETLTAAWEPESAQAQPDALPALGLADQLRFQSAVRQVREALAERPRAQRQENTGQLDIEALQQAVDSRQFAPENVSAQPQEAPGANGIAEQLRTGILDNVRQGKSEFVVRLKPAGLGEITVKLTESKNEISLRIVTSSAAVGRMIANDVNALQNALRPLRAQVEEIVTVPAAAQADAAQAALAGEPGERQFAWHNQQQENGGYRREQESDEDFGSMVEAAAPDDANVNVLI